MIPFRNILVKVRVLCRRTPDRSGCISALTSHANINFSVVQFVMTVKTVMATGDILNHILMPWFFVNVMLAALRKV